MKTITSIKGIISTCVLSSVLLLTACSKDGDSNPAAVQPTLTTTVATNISSTGATLGGNVTSLGNQNIQARGVVLATNANPTMADLYELASGSGLGPFVVANTRTLVPNTLYHVRAFIQTDTGISYGNDITFTTLP